MTLKFFVSFTGKPNMEVVCILRIMFNKEVWWQKNAIDAKFLALHLGKH